MDIIIIVGLLTLIALAFSVSVALHAFTADILTEEGEALDILCITAILAALGGLLLM